MNVTLSPAGVCWVEFSDSSSAARAALRDGENSSGHALRVTLLHPQPQQPAMRAPVEWYPQQVDVAGSHLASDLASLRVRVPCLAPPKANRGGREHPAGVPRVGGVTGVGQLARLRMAAVERHTRAWCDNRR